MLVSNSKLNNTGWAAMIRDIESLYQQLVDLGQDAEGQSQSLSTIQQSLNSTNNSVQSLANQLAALQTTVSGLRSAVDPQAFGAYANAAALPSGSYGSAATFTSLTERTGNSNFSGATYTVPTSGVYMVGYDITLFVSGATLLEGYVSGCPQTFTALSEVASSGAADLFVSGSAIVKLTAGATLGLVVGWNAPSSVGATCYAEFYGFRIS